jgi:hypothetical protein
MELVLLYQPVQVGKVTKQAVNGQVSRPYLFSSLSPSSPPQPWLGPAPKALSSRPEFSSEQRSNLWRIYLFLHHQGMVIEGTWLHTVLAEDSAASFFRLAFVPVYQIKRCQSPDDRNLNIHRYLILISDRGNTLNFYGRLSSLFLVLW